MFMQLNILSILIEKLIKIELSSYFNFIICRFFAKLIEMFCDTINNIEIFCDNIENFYYK